MYIAPEIPGYAQNIIKSAIGTRAEIQSFRWADGGGLYNKVYCLDTNEEVKVNIIIIRKTPKKLCSIQSQSKAC